ncbi:MAG: hypothetical protein A3G43_04010 [Ignavibacteria bacterium RIFCSPLOWO2_12_FULL_56_21]|nr:MAG: hypothetical protein A3G43_04010 [Ignavibacteria bacterium RIFCSPLOWO2_12_FULL_56_21]
MIRTLILCSAAVFIFMNGCDTRSSVASMPLPSHGVYILNEGTYQSRNAEISFYDPTSGTVYGNLYAAANADQALGDIANDIQVADGKLFIVVNYSRKVEVIAVGTNRKIASIPMIGEPRYIRIVSPTKAYVTNMDSTVSVLDLGTWTEVRRIRVGDYPEGILMAGNKLFVLNGGFGSGGTISVISVDADSVIATVATPDGPSYGVAGNDGRLYISCTGYSEYGHPENDTPGGVIVIDPVSLTVVDSLAIQGHPGKLAIDSLNTLYVLALSSTGSSSVWKIVTGPHVSVLNHALVSGSFYGIGIHATRGELYLADAGDYVTPGRVAIHTLNGTFVRGLRSGIGVAPNGFAFVP